MSINQGITESIFVRNINYIYCKENIMTIKFAK